MSDEAIDLSDIPEVTEEQMKRAVLRVGGKPVERSQRRVDLLLDAFIVEYFEAKAGDQEYQALINLSLNKLSKLLCFSTLITARIRALKRNNIPF
ncbi:hypothetical protein [Floridanema evergladense]|uniref:Uncharacterized protein n=1 Tax=Floridaenema evergladense BLCC-F167 TaxID=3153639 RepID=A0ABV4WDM7_9CYAN